MLKKPQASTLPPIPTINVENHPKVVKVRHEMAAVERRLSELRADLASIPDSKELRRLKAQAVIAGTPVAVADPGPLCDAIEQLEVRQQSLGASIFDAQDSAGYDIRAEVKPAYEARFVAVADALGKLRTAWQTVADFQAALVAGGVAMNEPLLSPIPRFYDGQDLSSRIKSIDAWLANYGRTVSQQ